MSSILAFGLVALMVAASASCSTKTPSQARAGEVYDASIRWLASDSSNDPNPIRVFIEPRGEGTAIALDVQAEVVAATHDVADVRFIDARDEALITAEDGTTVVRDDGMLIRLGPVVEDGERIALEVDRWSVDNTFMTFRFSLRRVGDQWQVLNDPVRTGTLDLES